MIAEVTQILQVLLRLLTEANDASEGLRFHREKGRILNARIQLLGGGAGGHASGGATRALQDVPDHVTTSLADRSDDLSGLLQGEAVSDLPLQKNHEGHCGRQQ